MYDLELAVLLLHIYCIYDSDMTHGGLRYFTGFGGVESQCYLWLQQSLLLLRRPPHNGKSCLIPRVHAAPLASRTQNYIPTHVWLSKRGYDWW